MDQLSKATAQTVAGSVGHHSFSDEEVFAYAEHVNHYLKDDPDTAEFLPINPESSDLFTAVGDGIILCKLVNKANPGTIDVRAINTKKPLNVFQKNINLNLAIESAKSIGVVVVNVKPNLITDKREHIILGLMWQIIKIQLTSLINLKHNPFLIRLKKEEEELSDLLKLPPDELLLRWFNYHLANSNYGKHVGNFSKDLQDGEAYVHLLNQLDKDRCDKSALGQQGEERAKTIIANAQKLGVPPFMRPKNITGAHPKLNLIFCAQLFNNCPGLTPTEEDFAAAKMLDDDDPESSQEERIFKMWINSLNIEEAYIHNLFEDMKDGIKLPYLEDKLRPGVVNWKKITKPAKSRIVKVQNANYALEVAKEFKITLANVGGVDFVDGKKKLILGVIWQLFRQDVLKTLGELTDDKILEWGNSRIPKEAQVTSFKDPNIKKGHYFFELLKSIEPRAIDQEYVQPGDTPEEQENNAKYIISVARRLGATVFLIWEQIRDGKAKMLAVFVASLMSFEKAYAQLRKDKADAEKFKQMVGDQQ